MASRDDLGLSDDVSISDYAGAAYNIIDNLIAEFGSPLAIT